MEEQTPNMPQNTPPPEVKTSKCGIKHDHCHCKGILALLIIILVWWAPTWANIGITVLAVLIILATFGCICKKKK